MPSFEITSIWNVVWSFNLPKQITILLELQFSHYFVIQKNIESHIRSIGVWWCGSCNRNGITWIGVSTQIEFVGVSATNTHEAWSYSFGVVFFIGGITKNNSKFISMKAKSLSHNFNSYKKYFMASIPSTNLNLSKSEEKCASHNPIQT